MKNIDDLSKTGSFIHKFIKEDLEDTTKLVTRFPPEPSGYLHIGHAKSIYLNYGLAKMYGGKINLRFDDTNPIKEEREYISSIIEDVVWLGVDFDNTYYASDYFEKFYEYAKILIKKNLAFVCDLSYEQIKEFRGNLNTPGIESPYRNRTIEENLELFEMMKYGNFEDGSKILRAKIDMQSPNLNMRDPVIYRILRAYHYNTLNNWCIYPMYDFAHPLGDAIEGITHSICTLEFENHRPLYNWFIDNLEFETKPRQIEFAKLCINNTITGKRYLKSLVDKKDVDGWDDPRLMTISGLRRRGYTTESIKKFCNLVGVSKADNKVELSLLEHVIRDDLKYKTKSFMAILNPIKVIITNLDDDYFEILSIENNSENSDLGTRDIIFSKIIYIENDDFSENPSKNFHRLYIGSEVRLKGAYFIKCEDIIKDSEGNIIEIHCTYDKDTKSGSGFVARKVKGTIHWISAKNFINIEARLYENLGYENEEGEFIKNDNSINIFKNAIIEYSILNYLSDERFQFMRNGYFCIDKKCSTKNNLVLNRIVALKSSYK